MKLFQTLLPLNLPDKPPLLTDLGGLSPIGASPASRTEHHSSPLFSLIYVTEALSYRRIRLIVAALPIFPVDTNLFMLLLVSLPLFL